MNKSNLKKNQILQIFKSQKCLILEDLCRSLNYSARSTQRLLRAVGYFSSFTHNGKWYILQNIPEFDRNGLWFYQGIGFSKWRDLNTTIRHLIENSVEGLMANNLSKTLSTSCSPVLNRLHKANKIDRVKTHRGFVYLSIEPTVKKRQVAYIEKKHRLQRPSDTDTITILIEFIRNPDRTFEELASHLNKIKSFCSADMIKNMFIYFGLEKKIPKKPKKS